MKWRNTTRGGKTVRIYAEDGEPNWPIHGAIQTDHGWESRSWRRDGTCNSSFISLVSLAPIIDWPAQPAWCKAVAMDENGTWCRFEHWPHHRDYGVWLRGDNGGFCQPMHPSEYPQWGGDWKDSLCVRPEGGAA